MDYNISLGKLTIELGEDEDVVLNADELLVIGADLSLEFTRQASSYAYVAMLSARADGLWQETKRDLDEVYAQTDKEVRRDILSDGDKVTEGKVQQGVQLRRGYIEAAMEELFYREQHLVMRALERSMDMRASMLISLGAHLRAEAQQTGMVIKDFKETLRAQSKATTKETKEYMDALDTVEKIEEQVLDDAEEKVPF